MANSIDPAAHHPKAITTEKGTDSGEPSQRRKTNQPPRLWQPESLIDDEALRLFRSRNFDGTLPLITSNAIRYNLYKQLHRSGEIEMDGIAVSIEWAVATLVYSGLNITKKGPNSESMTNWLGYPQPITQIHRTPEIFRIYATSEVTVERIIEGAQLLSSFHGYITGVTGPVHHYMDLTGVYITRPNVSPSDVWLDSMSYRHFVDFRMNEAIPVLRLPNKSILLIPGPARITDKVADDTLERILSENPQPNDRWDVAEILKMFGRDFPRFKIPIDVVSSGKLTLAGGGSERSNTSSTASDRFSMAMRMRPHSNSAETFDAESAIASHEAGAAIYSVPAVLPIATSIPAFSF